MDASQDPTDSQQPHGGCIIHLPPTTFHHSVPHSFSAIPPFTPGNVANLPHIDPTQVTQKSAQRSISSDPVDRSEPMFLHQLQAQHLSPCLHALSQHNPVDLSRSPESSLFSLPSSLPLPLPDSVVEAPSDHQMDLVLDGMNLVTSSQGLNTATSQVLHALSNLCPQTSHPPRKFPRLPRPSQRRIRLPPSISPPLPPPRPTHRAELVSPTVSTLSPQPPQPPQPSSQVAPSSNRRRRLTMDETEYLLAQFCKNEKPNTKERQVFAEHLNLHPRTIQVWFQNRRAKLKRDDSLAKAFYPQLAEMDDEEDEDEGFVKSGLERGGYNGLLAGPRGKYVGGKTETDGRTYHNVKQNGGTLDRGIDQHGAKVHTTNVGKGDTGVQDMLPARMSLATRVKEKLKSHDDASHRGTGTETFIGCERSDGELEWLLECEPEQIPSSWERLDLTTRSPSGTLGNDDGTSVGSARSAGSRGKGGGDDEKGSVEYCDISALDLGLDLMYELVFGLPPDPLAREEPCRSPTLSSGDGSSVASMTSIEISNCDRDKDADKAQDVKARELAMRTFNCTPEPKTTIGERPYPIQPNRQTNRLLSPKTGRAKHSSLLLHHNPIPRHQMALTLVSAADHSLASLDSPR